MRKFMHNKFFKPCAAALLVVILACSFILPAFAITPKYVSTQDNPYSRMDFVEERLTRRLVKFYDYSMNSISNAVDKQFANAFFPSHSNYYTPGDFDSLMINAFSFCAGEELAQVSQWQGYRFIAYDPIRRGTSYTFVVAKSPIWTTAQFTLEARALGRPAYRFKQTNTNTSADGGKRRFAVYNVFFPRTWSGGTTGVVCTKKVIIDNAYPASGSGWLSDAPYVFAFENILWMDNATLTLFGSNRDFTNLNMFYADSVWMDCVNPTISLSVASPTQTNTCIQARFDSERLASQGQYSIDFEFYYYGLSVSDDFVFDLVKAANPIRLSKKDGSSPFDVLSYELLQGAQRTMTSGGEDCYYITFRVYFQPPTVALNLQYKFNIVWFEHLFWSTPLTNNATTFALTNLTADTGDGSTGDILAMWSKLTKSIDFARVVVQQLWIAMPPDIYSLLTVALYLIIALAVIRLVI